MGTSDLQCRRVGSGPVVTARTRQLESRWLGSNSDAFGLTRTNCKTSTADGHATDPGVMNVTDAESTR